jgi:hypothetical protein
MVCLVMLAASLLRTLSPHHLLFPLAHLLSVLVLLALLELLGLLLALLHRKGKEVGILLEPRVLHDDFECRTKGRVWNEHLEEQVPSLGGDVVGESEGRVKDVAIELLDIVALWILRVIVKREVSCQHGIQNDTARPNVYSRADVETFAYHELGSSVAWAATTRLHEIVGLVLKLVGKAEIGHDDVPITVEQ